MENTHNNNAQWLIQQLPTFSDKWHLFILLEKRRWNARVFESKIHHNIYQLNFAALAIRAHTFLIQIYCYHCYAT